MSNKNIGPAFPSTISNSSETPVTGFCGEQIMPNKFSAYPGLSIRDYFAAKAMAAMIHHVKIEWPDDKLIIMAAYRMADGMLAERAK